MIFLLLLLPPLLSLAYLGFWIPWRERIRLRNLRQERLCPAPEVLFLSGFLDDGEIAFLKKTGSPGLKPSRVHAGTESAISSIRTSSSFQYFFFFNYHPKMHRLRCRASALTGIPVGHIESLQLCRYLEGQEFAPHHDYFTERRSFPQQAYQRIATVLVYLTDNETGATQFPLLNLAVRPQKGAALFWKNCLADGTTDPRTLHAGTPVRGEKWIVNLFIRERSLVSILLKHYLLHLPTYLIKLARRIRS